VHSSHFLVFSSQFVQKNTSSSPSFVTSSLIVSKDLQKSEKICKKIELFGLAFPISVDRILFLWLLS